MSKKKMLTPSEILQRDAESAWDPITVATTAKTLLISNKIFKVDESGVLIFTISNVAYQKYKKRIEAFFRNFRPKSFIDSRDYRSEIKEDNDNFTYYFYHPTMYKSPDQWDLSQAAHAIVENLALRSGANIYTYYSNLNPNPTITAELNNKQIVITVSKLVSTKDQPLKAFLKHQFLTLKNELSFSPETGIALTKVKSSECFDSIGVSDGIFISFTLYPAASVDDFVQHIQSHVHAQNITFKEEIEADLYFLLQSEPEMLRDLKRELGEIRKQKEEIKKEKEALRRDQLLYAIKEGPKEEIDRILADRTEIEEIKKSEEALCDQLLHAIDFQEPIEEIHRILAIWKTLEISIDSLLANGFPPLTSAVRQNDIKLVKLFLNYGANIEEVGYPDQITPLAMALFKSDHDILQLLLQCGADPNTNLFHESVADYLDTITHYLDTITHDNIQRPFNCLSILLDYGLTISDELRDRLVSTFNRKQFDFSFTLENESKQYIKKAAIFKPGEVQRIVSNNTFESIVTNRYIASHNIPEKVGDIPGAILGRVVGKLDRDSIKSFSNVNRAMRLLLSDLNQTTPAELQWREVIREEERRLNERKESKSIN